MRTEHEIKERIKSLQEEDKSILVTDENYGQNDLLIEILEWVLNEKQSDL